MTGVPSAEELPALPAAELAVRLAEAYRLIAELTAQVERLSARVEDLERQARVRRGPGRGAGHGPARSANLVSGHYIPVYRATLLLCQLAGIAVSTGWMAGHPVPDLHAYR